MNIEKLLPHRPPMRFIDELTQCDATGARATARFPADHFAVSDGRVTEAALVECVAQTFAAALGHNASGSGQKPAIGMLAAITDFQIQTCPAADTQLEIEVHEVRRLGPMRLVTGKITAAGQTIAAGGLTLYA